MERMSGFLDETAALCRKYGLPDTQLVRGAGELRGYHVRAAVLGGFNTGKSALVNALAGAYLSRVSLCGETRVPAEIFYGTQGVQVVRNGAAVRSDPVGAAPGRRAGRCAARARGAAAARAAGTCRREPSGHARARSGARTGEPCAVAARAHSGRLPACCRRGRSRCDGKRHGRAVRPFSGAKAGAGGADEVRPVQPGRCARHCGEAAERSARAAGIARISSSAA